MFNAMMLNFQKRPASIEEELTKIIAKSEADDISSQEIKDMDGPAAGDSK